MSGRGGRGGKLCRCISITCKGYLKSCLDTWPKIAELDSATQMAYDMAKALIEEKCIRKTLHEELDGYGFSCLESNTLVQLCSYCQLTIQPHNMSQELEIADSAGTLVVGNELNSQLAMSQGFDCLTIDPFQSHLESLYPENNLELGDDELIQSNKRKPDNASNESLPTSKKLMKSLPEQELLREKGKFSNEFTFHPVVNPQSSSSVSKTIVDNQQSGIDMI